MELLKPSEEPHKYFSACLPYQASGVKHPFTTALYITARLSLTPGNLSPNPERSPKGVRVRVRVNTERKYTRQLPSLFLGAVDVHAVAGKKKKISL